MPIEVLDPLTALLGAKRKKIPDMSDSTKKTLLMHYFVTDQTHHLPKTEITF